MEKKKNKTLPGFIILFILLIFFLILNISLGSKSLGLAEVLDVLLGRGDFVSRQIIMDIRLPRIVGVLFLGGALSVSGFLLQTFFQNPIAGPFVLGISSGAKLVVAMVMIFFLKYAMVVNSAVMILAAFLGAMISMGFILLISDKVKRMSVLIICGIMISYICSAITDFVITFAEDSNIVNLHNWSMGSFSGLRWSNIILISLVVCIAMVLTFLLSKSMDAFRLGESYARSAGVNIKSFRVKLILLSSLLAATVTAFAGPISFVGIAVPHLIRSLFKTSKPIIMIPACFLGGSVFCLFSDLLARMLFAPTELSISTVTSLIGAPIVIRLMLMRQRR